VFGPLKRLVVGRPIATYHAEHHRFGLLGGLAVLSSDPLSSVAYATEEVLRVLMLGGVGALSLGLPIYVLIATLLSIIFTFADFQLIYVLTKGGPANQTHIFGTYAYQIGLSATEIGMGAAIALYMFPILTVFAVILLVYLRREE